MSQLSFIHASDLHLGSPLETDAGGVADVRAAVNEATYRACERIVDRALAEAVNFVVFSGDLYDKASRSVRANQFINEQFSRLAEEDIQVFLIYGNHDPFGAGHEFFDFPENVTRFPSAEPESAVVEENGRTIARVLGQSYRTRHEDRSMYTYFTPSDQEVPNIGLLHTALDPESNRYVPCSAAELREKTDIDYWALGHRHGLDVYPGRPLLAYPGTPQGRSIDEAGPGGCLLVEPATGSAPELTFLPTSEVVWVNRSIDLTGRDEIESVGDLESLLETEARKLLDGGHAELVAERSKASGIDYNAPDYELRGFICRWTLQGRCPVHQQITGRKTEVRNQLTEALREHLGAGSPFVWTESLRFQTARQLPELDELLEKDEVYRELQQIVEEFRGDAAQLEELVELCGKQREFTEDSEDLREGQFQLTREQLEAYLLQARDRVIDKLYERGREHVD